MTFFSRFYTIFALFILLSVPAIADCEEPEVPECVEYLKSAPAAYADSCRNKIKGYLVQLDEWISCVDDPAAYDKAAEKVNEISLKILESIGI